MKQNKPLFIGITGGVGAGKSSILQYIGENYSCEIYLADQVAHEVKRKGTGCYADLVKLLGEDVLDEDGEIHKGRMAQKIFADDTLLQHVNELIHPAVRVYLLEKLAEARKLQSVDFFFVEAALLIECGYGELVDEMWYIYADADTRRERLRSSRGYSEEKIDQIIASQISEDEYRNNCDFVIDNSGAYEDSCRQIAERMKTYLS